MSFENAMDLVMRLLSQAQALAALTARLRLAEMGISDDSPLLPHLDKVMRYLGAQSLQENLSEQERTILIAFARSYLRQALELMEEPIRPGSWTHTDPDLLQAQGSFSAVVASLIHQANIGKPDARILDIGTGVGALAIAFCKAFPQSTVVGLDPWEPALKMAQRNVAAAGMDKRITLQQAPIQSYVDGVGFDLVWFPSFFIPETVLDEALLNVYRITRPDASVVMGCTFNEVGNPLLAAVDDLMTVRSGGTPLTPEDAMAYLTRAGFTDARQVPRTWKAPVEFVVGKRMEDKK